VKAARHTAYCPPDVVKIADIPIGRAASPLPGLPRRRADGINVSE
jgi:hypothetical protein